MIDHKIVFRIIGQLLFIEAIMMVVCLVVSLGYGEDDSYAFIVSLLITICGGIGFRYVGRQGGNNLSRCEAYIVVALTWVVFSFFGTLPYLVGGYIRSFTDAYFESMAGFSTTGATVLDDVEWMPHAMLFWRSMTQWIGGLGIVFFTIAILPSMVGGSVKVFAAEATGPIKSKLHPRLSTGAKWLWSIYLALTIGCTTAFYACGMGWFDSINYAMTTTATGGFAPHNDGLAHYGRASVEYVATVFQFLSGINFMLLYMVVFKGKVRLLLGNSEFRLFGAATVVATVWIMVLLMRFNGYGLEHALRSAAFHVVSMMTTTGLVVDDLGRWPQIAWLLLICLMFSGACAGSTSGGFKCVRIVMILSVIKNEFRHILHPNAVLPIKVNGQAVPADKLPTLLAFFAVSVGMCVAISAMMTAIGVDAINSAIISLSMVSNVGLPLNTGMGPEMSWGMLPVAIKWALSLLMLMGRLEIMTVLLLFTRSFWKDH